MIRLLRVILLTSVFASPLVFGVAPHAFAQTTTLSATADTYLQQGSANKNQGDETFLRLRSSGKNRTLVRFDQTGIAATVGAGTLVSATLELTIELNSNNWGSDGRTVDAHGLEEDWTELGATWNCGDDTNTGNSQANCTTQWDGGTFAVTPTDTLLHTNGLSGIVQYDVTSDVLAFLAGTSNYGWLLKKTVEGQNGRVEYTSLNGTAGQEPKLVLVVESATTDEVPPQLQITAPDSAFLVNEPTPEIIVTYVDNGTGVDTSSLQVSIDSVDITANCTIGAASATCTAPQLATGPHTISILILDIAGNLATASRSFELFLGTGPHTATFPVIADTYLKQGTDNQNQGGETFLRVRSSGKNRALVRFNETEITTVIGDGSLVSATLELFLETNGNNWGDGRTVDVHRVTEDWSEFDVTWNCAIDTDVNNQSPDCTTQWNGGSFVADPTDSILHTNGLMGVVQFNVTADVDAFLTGTTNFGWLLKKTAEGQNGRAEYTSREGVAGQEARLIVAFEASEPGDTTPPTINITAPSVPVINDPTPEITVEYNDVESAIDLGSVQVSLEVQGFGMVDITQNCTINIADVSCPPTLLPEGQHILNAAVADQAGNQAQASFNFEVATGAGTDTQPPSVAILLSPPANPSGWNNTDVAISFECVDNESGIAFCSEAFTLANEGSQDVAGAATDLANNMVSTNVSVRIDKTAPMVAITSLPDTATLNTGQFSVTGSTEDVLSGLDNVSCNGAEAVISQTTFSCDVSLAEGANTITVLATDVAGNTSTDVASVTFVPTLTVTITDPSNQSLATTDTITVTGTVDDGASAVTINGVAATVSGGIFSANVSLHEGDNTITAVAQAVDGRTGLASIQVLRDTTPPLVTIDAPLDGSVANIATITVTGMVNDIVVGTVNGEQAQVTVNGIPAAVANRSFLVENIALSPGLNTITATATDQAGNIATTSSTVTFEDSTGQAHITLVSGNNQTAPNGSPLTEPAVVRLSDATGNPVAGQSVLFKIIENNGFLSGPNAGRSAFVQTDSQGQAQVTWTLGTRAGAGNNKMEATAVGFTGKGVFTATALPTAANKINVDNGNNQTGAVGQPLPRPFAVVVTDTGHNRINNVPVTFTVREGGGTFAGQMTVTVNTDTDGRAQATLTLGLQQGFDNNIAQASFPNNPSSLARFVASGRVVGDPANTSVSGIILDNTDVPIEGVTVQVEGTALATQTDTQGHFVLQAAPVGKVVLLVDGSTALRPGTFPSLQYEFVTVAGQDNTVGRPIFLLPLDLPNGLFVDETTGGTLTIPSMPGFALDIVPGSATFPDGSTNGLISATVVHADKVPMTPNFGQQPRFVVTIQPSGVLFDPPAALTLPNVDGLAPGEITDLFSFDHDLEQFVSIGPGSVSEDGLVIRSTSGTGILKGGWHCGGNPDNTGDCEDTKLSVDEQLVLGVEEIAVNLTARASPLSGSFMVQVADPAIATVEFEGSTTAPNGEELLGLFLVDGLAPGETTATITYTPTSGEEGAVSEMVQIIVTQKFTIDVTTFIPFDFGRPAAPYPFPPGPGFMTGAGDNRGFNFND